MGRVIDSSAQLMSPSVELSGVPNTRPTLQVTVTECLPDAGADRRMPSKLGNSVTGR
jgi:hypothetical protein